MKIECVGLNAVSFSPHSGQQTLSTAVAAHDRGCVKTLDLVFCRGISGGTRVTRFVEGQDRAQLMLLPECLDDFVGEDNPVRVVDAFIEELDLALLGFAGIVPEATGRPSYHPATLLKIYLCWTEPTAKRAMSPRPSRSGSTATRFSRAKARASHLSCRRP